MPCRRMRPTPSPPTKRAAITRRCSIPRWSTRPTARSSSPISCSRSPASKATGRWPPSAQEEIARIRAQVGKSRVICGLSGGVDSAVAAVLIHEAIGDQLICVFVDHGLMRQGEADEVVNLFRGHFNIPLVHVDAAEEFIAGARGRRGPRGQAQDDREIVHRHVRGGGAPHRERRQGAGRVSGARHALSRRDRERVVFRRPVGHDQEPPQRRRPARAHAHEAGRAVARIVQGRGARSWPRARPAGGVRRPPSLSGPRPRRPLPGGVTREKLDILRQADADLSRRDPQGRPLRQDLAGVRRAAAGAHGRRDGRRAHLRLRRARCAR